MAETMNEPDIPLDYQFVDWKHLHEWIGRAFIGHGVPMMNDRVAAYLENQARQMEQAAARLKLAAEVVKARKE